MTNTHAINLLQRISLSQHDDEKREALEMAVRALQTDGDLVSRQQAIDAINKKKIYRPLDSDRWVISDCLNAIVNLPSAQPERKKGKWIFQTIKQGKRMWCSNCNSAFDLCCNQIERYDEATEKDYLWVYCPWCGADMRGESE